MNPAVASGNVDDLLEIQIITYNRSAFLERTLRQLAESPFSQYKITLFDNCSTDATPDVCEALKGSFLRLKIVRHPKNIGGNANYLRAVELSTSRYTWVVCDDDTFDFSAASEVIDAIARGKDDLILLRPVTDGGVVRTGRTTAQSLIADNYMFYFSLSFFPAIIFRTSLFDSESLMYGYRLIPDSYPQFEFINKAVRDDVTVFIPAVPMVIRNDVNISTFSPLSWYKAWITCCRTITDLKLRKETISQATRLRGFVKSLAFWIALEKKINKRDFYHKVATIFIALDPPRKLLFLLFTPVVVIPLPYKLLLVARQIVYWLLRVPKDQVPPVEFDHQL